MSVAAAAGIAVYAGLLAGSLWLLFRQSRASGLVAPILVALILRLTVMVATHFISIHRGDHGFFYLDDQGYDRVGWEIAKQWRDGSFVSPETAAGSIQFGYQALVGSIYTLVGGHVIAAKLVNVLLGTAIVLLAAKLAGHVVGSAAEGPVAWLVAVWPTLLWWSSMMLKESLIGFLLLATLVASLHLYKLRGLSAAALALVGLSITRVSAAVAVVVTLGVGLGLAAIRRRSEVDWRAIAGLVSGALACVLVLFTVIGYGDPQAIWSKYVLHTLHQVTQTRLAGVPHDVAQTLVVVRPPGFTVSSVQALALYPGAWLWYAQWYALLAMAVLGAWRLRRHLDGLLLALPIVVLLALTAYFVGVTFRQRSNIEPLIIVLVVVGFTSWERLAYVASAGLLAAAATAMFLAHARLAAALIAGGAIGLAALSRVLPSDDRGLHISQTSCLESCVVGVRFPTLRHRWSPPQETVSSRPKHPV
jgi:hypothetical protein